MNVSYGTEPKKGVTLDAIASLFNVRIDRHRSFHQESTWHLAGNRRNHQISAKVKKDRLTVMHKSQTV